MNIKFLVVGKTDTELYGLVEKYQNRIKSYIFFEEEVLPDIKNTKNLTFQQQKQKEGEMILKKIAKTDFLVLLDEAGTQYTSEKFADFLQKRMNASTKNLVFLVGGAFGFSADVYQRADAKLSLSAMTFSHQMVRLFFCEQLYRAFSILNSEPYHHK